MKAYLLIMMAFCMVFLMASWVATFGKEKHRKGAVVTAALGLAGTLLMFLGI